MKFGFLSLTAVLLIPLIFVSNSMIMPSHLESITGTLKYVIIVNGVRTDDPFDIVSFQCTVSLRVKNNQVTDITATDFMIDNLPYAVSSRFREFVKSLIIKWFNSFNILDKSHSNYKTYISVNGKIIEAYIIDKRDGIEYREVNTGLYVGGDQFLQISVGFTPLVSLKYNLSIISYLFSVEPDQLMNYFSIIEPPTEQVRDVAILVAVAVVVLAIRSLAKWEEYSIM